MKALFLAVFVFALSGCANYQLGDYSKDLYNLRKEYCLESNPIAKYILLTSIKKRFETYPEEGVCTDFVGGFIDEYRVPD
jgi:hypothetical protein